MVNKKSWAIIFCISVIAVMLAVTVYESWNSNEQFASGATVASSNLNIGVYSDSGCSKALSSINWGTLKLGTTATCNVWVKNNGSSKLTLAMTTNNWSPTSMSNSILISWDQNKTVINPGQIVKSTVTLAVSSSPRSFGAFNVTIVITGTG